MIFQLSPSFDVRWVYMLVGGIILFVVNMVIAKYIHKDAIKRRIKNSDLWLLIGFIFGVFGLTLYIYVRKDYEERT